METNFHIGCLEGAHKPMARTWKVKDVSETHLRSKKIHEGSTSTSHLHLVAILRFQG